MSCQCFIVKNISSLFEVVSVLPIHTGKDASVILEDVNDMDSAVRFINDSDINFRTIYTKRSNLFFTENDLGVDYHLNPSFIISDELSIEHLILLKYAKVYEELSLEIALYKYVKMLNFKIKNVL